MGYKHRWTAPRLIPQREFNPIPKAELVVNYPQVILHDVLRCPNRFCHFAILQAFGNEFNDSVFTFTGDTGPITSIC